MYEPKLPIITMPRNPLINLRLGKKLSILIGIPTIAMLALAFIESGRIMHEISDSNRFVYFVDLSVEGSHVLHELQKERGASAGFLSSSGLKFGQILKQQRRQTDERIALFHEFQEKFDSTDFDESTVNNLQEIKTLLAQLQAMRNSVDRQSISVNDQLHYYTKLNEQLLKLTDALAHYSPSGKVANTGTAFAAFLHSKEQAGLERAVLSNVFANDAFKPGAYRQLTDLINTQIVYLDVFEAVATSEQKKLFEQTSSDASFAQVEKMRSIAIEANDSGNFGVDAESWFETITQKINKLKIVEDELALIIGDQARDKAAAALLEAEEFVGVIVGALILSTLFGFAVSRQILNSVTTARTMAIAIKDGHLDTPVHTDSTDEIGQMLSALESMQSNLKDIVGTAQSVSSSIRSSANGVHASTITLNHRTNEQSSYLENTASSTEEIASTVKHNAERATEAQSLTDDAHEHAVTGGQVVEGAVAAMEEITTSSREIAAIISVIDDIAFQTNLLALNAAVEAARAGEQGRGFAVVASEVRTLAGRSAEAAKEIKQLITSSVEKVELGSEMVGQSGKTLIKIVESVSEVKNLMDAMATAGGEQAIGVEGINKSMVEIDGLTQKNTTMVQEIATSSEMMKNEAEKLDQRLSYFKITEEREV